MGLFDSTELRKLYIAYSGFSGSHSGPCGIWWYEKASEASAETEAEDEAVFTFPLVSPFMFPSKAI